MGLVSELRAIPLFAELAEDALHDPAIRVQRCRSSGCGIARRCSLRGSSPRSRSSPWIGHFRSSCLSWAPFSAASAITFLGRSSSMPAKPVRRRYARASSAGGTRARPASFSSWRSTLIASPTCAPRCSQAMRRCALRAAGGQPEERLDAGAADAKSVLLDVPAPGPRAGAWSESLSSRELAECARGARWNRAAHPCLDRIARFITNREVGVAVSVGAAAGFAHLGFLQVLEDCGVPIDFVCGSSMGGVVALGFGQLREASKATDALCTLGAAFARSRGLQVVPRAALVSTQRMREIAKEMFGGIYFAELGLPVAAVAADLVAGERVILDGCSSPARLEMR